MASEMIDKIYILAVAIDSGKVGIPALGADAVLVNVLKLVFYVAGVVCVIALIAAGLLYATANGEADKIKTAKNAIMYAVIGLLCVMMAFGITGFIVGRFE
jgi:hypothetical protein